MPKILLVDDDTALRRMLRLTLEEMGFVVVEARNGREAIVSFQSDPADVILLDLIMPEKEGIETIRELRRDQWTVPIVAMSGGGHIDSRNLLTIASLLGANCVLAKPFSSDQLSAALKAVLAKSSE